MEIEKTQAGRAVPAERNNRERQKDPGRGQRRRRESRCQKKNEPEGCRLRRSKKERIGRWAAWAAVWILCGMLLSVPACGAMDAEAAQLQQGIAGEVLRFHVLANSDSPADQELKLQVKDALVEKLRPLLESCGTARESEVLVAEKLEEIREWAGEEIRRAGYDYPAEVRLCDAWFPEKAYGDCVFPKGVYRALQVRIGNAGGRNWWCLLFPGLCFSGTLEGKVSPEGKEKLREVLTEEEYEAVTGRGELRFGFRWL